MTGKQKKRSGERGLVLNSARAGNGVTVRKHEHFLLHGVVFVVLGEK
jgi:hypothetical protein